MFEKSYAKRGTRKHANQSSVRTREGRQVPMGRQFPNTAYRASGQYPEVWQRLPHGYCFPTEPATSITVVRLKDSARRNHAQIPEDIRESLSKRPILHFYPHAVIIQEIYVHPQLYDHQQDPQTHRHCGRHEKLLKTHLSSAKGGTREAVLIVGAPRDAH
jgi:hypothetical protein